MWRGLMRMEMNPPHNFEDSLRLSRELERDYAPETFASEITHTLREIDAGRVRQFRDLLQPHFADPGTPIIVKAQCFSKSEADAVRALLNESDQARVIFSWYEFRAPSGERGGGK